MEHDLRLRGGSGNQRPARVTAKNKSRGSLQGQKGRGSRGRSKAVNPKAVDSLDLEEGNSVSSEAGPKDSEDVDALLEQQGLGWISKGKLEKRETETQGPRQSRGSSRAEEKDADRYLRLHKMMEQCFGDHMKAMSPHLYWYFLEILWQLEDKVSEGATQEQNEEMSPEHLQEWNEMLVQVEDDFQEYRDYMRMALEHDFLNETEAATARQYVQDSNMTMPRPGTPEAGAFWQFAFHVEEILSNPTNGTVDGKLVLLRPRPPKKKRELPSWIETLYPEANECDDRILAMQGSPDDFPHVDDYGFDKDGEFYPDKTLSEERYVELLQQKIIEDAELSANITAAENQEANLTGSIQKYKHWEYLDEDGYFLPHQLKPGSQFMKENPWCDPDWVLESPPKLRWRGPRIDEYNDDDGAVREWDIHTNSLVKVVGNATGEGNETTLFHHIGLGCMIEIMHRNHEWFKFRSSPQEQTYVCMSDCTIYETYGFQEVEMEMYAVYNPDDPENKLKASHLMAGEWRGKVHGPRIVLWNTKHPETEIHLTHDGFFILGDCGRCIQVVVNAVHPDRHSMYFLMTQVALDTLDQNYTKKVASIWHDVETRDLTGNKALERVLKYEKAPDWRLGIWTEETWKRAMGSPDGAAIAAKFDRGKAVDDMWKNRKEAARKRGDNFATPNISHFSELIPGFNHLFNLTDRLTPGKGWYDENEQWVDNYVFTEIPRFHQKLPHIDNEFFERKHFERLEEYRNLSDTWRNLMFYVWPPETLFWATEETIYAEPDAQGIPTHYVNGTEIPVEEREDLEETWIEHSRLHEDLKKMLDKQPDLMHRIRMRAAELKELITMYDPYQVTVDEVTMDYSFAKGEELPSTKRYPGSVEDGEGTMQWPGYFCPRW